MANYRRQRPVLALLVFLVVMASASTASCVASVYIFNDMEAPIQVQCRNTERNIIVKPTTLRRNQHVGLVFEPNVWGTTRYTCDFEWYTAGMWNSFDVWVDNFFLVFWGKVPCKQCTWLVDSSGFSEYKDGALGPIVGRQEWKVDTRD